MLSRRQKVAAAEIHLELELPEPSVQHRPPSLAPHKGGHQSSLVHFEHLATVSDIAVSEACLLSPFSRDVAPTLHLTPFYLDGTT